MLRILALAGLLFPASSAVFAQDRDRVDKLLRDLDSGDVNEREMATAALMKMGKGLQGRLKRVIHRTNSEEVRARLRQVVGSFGVASGGGKLSNGLKIVLTTDKEALKTGDRIELKAVIWNATAQAMNVYVGYSTGGVNLVNGSTYDITAPSQESSAKPKWNVGFCGTGAGPVYTTISPFSFQEFKTTAVLGSAGSKAQYRFGPKGWVSIAAPQGDLHRFRAVVTAGGQTTRIVDSPFGGGARSAGSRPLDRSVPVWVGHAVSNEIGIKIEK